jgi:hypothetical protein
VVHVPLPFGLTRDSHEVIDEFQTLIEPAQQCSPDEHGLFGPHGFIEHLTFVIDELGDASQVWFRKIRSAAA